MKKILLMILIILIVWFGAIDIILFFEFYDSGFEDFIFKHFFVNSK